VAARDGAAEEGGGGRQGGAQGAAARAPRGPGAATAPRPLGLPPTAHRLAGGGCTRHDGAGAGSNRPWQDASDR
jgi:hypothetical protein